MKNKFAVLGREEEQGEQDSSIRKEVKKDKEDDHSNSEKSKGESEDQSDYDSQYSDLSASSYDPQEERDLPWYDRVKKARHLLRKNPKPNEKKYTEQEAEDSLKQALFQMEGYDFLVSTKDIPKYVEGDRWDPDKPKRFRRVVYLRFLCEQCDKVFTSICGTLEATFWVRRLKKSEWEQYLNNKKKDKASSEGNPAKDFKDLDYPWMVRFTTRIYRMQCEDCKTYCVGKIFQTHLVALEIQFAHIIGEIVDKIPPPQPMHHNVPDNHFHKSEWCEACQLGRCVSQNIEKEWGKQTERRNGKIQAKLGMHEIKE